MTKKLMMLALTLAVAGGVMAGEGAKGEWTGYITDTHCGAKGATKDHTAACVEKCMKSGKAQLWIESEKKAHDLADGGFEKVKALVGNRVTVKGTMDKETGAITVESAAKAAEAAQ